MTLPMHAFSVPAFAKTLKAMLRWFDKAQAHADSRKFPVDHFLQTRLAPDMLPFVKQVQIACDHAKGCAARLAGVEIPRFEDSETTLEQLRERVRRTLEFIGSVPARAFEGSEGREVVLPLRSGELRLRGEEYLRHFALPNFYFHATTTYALLRAGGVELGKADFLDR